MARKHVQVTFTDYGAQALLSCQMLPAGQGLHVMITPSAAYVAQAMLLR